MLSHKKIAEMLAFWGTGEKRDIRYLACNTLKGNDYVRLSHTYVL